jgi:hypothetical protein
MLQATFCDSLALDPFAFEEDGLSASEVDVAAQAKAVAWASDRSSPDRESPRARSHRDQSPPRAKPAYVYRFTRSPQDRTRSRSARSIPRNLRMCSRRRRPSTGLGPTATERFPTRSSNTGRISPRPEIRTAWVCRNGRAMDRRRRPSWSLETGQIRCRCWTPNEKLCSTLIWRPVCRTDIRRRRPKRGSCGNGHFRDLADVGQAFNVPTGVHDRPDRGRRNDIS